MHNRNWFLVLQPGIQNNGLAIPVMIVIGCRCCVDTGQTVCIMVAVDRTCVDKEMRTRKSFLGNGDGSRSIWSHKANSLAATLNHDVLSPQRDRQTKRSITYLPAMHIKPIGLGYCIVTYYLLLLIVIDNIILHSITITNSRVL